MPIEETKEYVYRNTFSFTADIPVLWSLSKPTIPWASGFKDNNLDRRYFFLFKRYVLLNQTAVLDLRPIYQKCVGDQSWKDWCRAGDGKASSYNDIPDDELSHEMKAKIAYHCFLSDCSFLERSSKRGMLPSTSNSRPRRALTRAQGQTTTKGGGSARDPQDALIRHADATLGSGALRDVVRLPAGEDKNEWIAMNIVDFFHQISLLYGTITERCTAESCPRMSAGPDHEFFWADPRTNTPIACSAPEYINFLMTWVQDELDDESHFPSQIGKPFPANFMAIAQSIMKRLFRVYAHIYHHHFAYIEQLKAIEHLNTSFKHFLLFVREFQLVEAAQLAPLTELIEKLTSTA
ncbi:MOB kinase activator 1A [Aphelenchoides fujianensis]|nr:MOB kinase activator 1A [Aphelenchoides fujianensis]